MARGSAVSWRQLLYVFLVLCKETLSLDHVPMLLWSTDSSLHGLAKTLHEGHIMSMDKLYLLLKDTVLGPEHTNIVLFLQDRLSVEYFTQYNNFSGNESLFHNVQELLETSSSSLVLPAVDCHAVSHFSGRLQKTLNWNLVNVDSPDISKLRVNTSKPSLFEINLPPIRRKDELSTQNKLIENDEIIGRFIRSLRQQGIPFLAIYTAKQPSEVIRKHDIMWHSKRQLMSVESEVIDLYPPLNVTNGTNTTCILFYATNFTLTVNTTIHMNLTNSTFLFPNVDTTSSVCSDTNATLSLKYTNLENEKIDIKTLEIRFLMTNMFYTSSSKQWFTLDFIHILQDNMDAEDEPAKFNVSTIYGPAEYSFHCPLVGTESHYDVLLIPANGKAKQWKIDISDFQIQAFNIENNVFSYASDCTSFFTSVIWMGLVTSLILLFILTYGIHMIMNLTTNSRFDDPKGPTLSVPQTE
ncbi:V-type proton ATPase subunit S1-like [Thamnophis elegans]|uniref:V-type proton ATPase subunit S1-like n=1 Tax=Thamnophis elegans TaxID=35005 RepID=UPI001376CBBA|nr:V-type proton ATPase subunit S1-like [Thamnophis elegans]